jgi:hypothetical protein
MVIYGVALAADGGGGNPESRDGIGELPPTASVSPQN